MDDINKSRVVLGLSVAIMAVIVILLLVPWGTSQEPSRTMTQESIRQVNWVQVNPPPGIEGPCWAILDNGISGVWCE